MCPLSKVTTSPLFRYIDVSDVKVHDIFRVNALYTNGEGFKGVEGEGHETAGGRWRVLSKYSCVYPKL